MASTLAFWFRFNKQTLMHYAVQSPQRKKMGRCSVYASFNSSLTARKTFAAECFFQVVVGVVRKLAKLQQNAEQSPVARNLITCSSARMRSDRHTNKPGQTHAHKHTHTHTKSNRRRPSRLAPYSTVFLLKGHLKEWCSQEQCKITWTIWLDVSSDVFLIIYSQPDNQMLLFRLFRHYSHHIQGFGRGLRAAPVLSLGHGFSMTTWPLLKRLRTQRRQHNHKYAEGINCCVLVICLVFENQPGPTQTVLYQLLAGTMCGGDLWSIYLCMC